MKKLNAIFLALFLVTGACANAQGNVPLKLLHTTPLPGFAGDLDHFEIDLKGNRLFLTAEVHKTVEALRGLGHPTSCCFVPIPTHSS